MAIGINDLMGMMYQDGDIYDVPFTEDQLLPVVNRPNNLEMLRRIQEFREPVTVEQLIASLPIVPAVVPPAPPVISQPDDFNMLRRMQEFRETTPVSLEQVIASLPVAPPMALPVAPPVELPVAPPIVPPVAPPPVISPPDDFEMLRRMQEFRETAPTVPVAPAAPRISEDVGLVPSRIVEPPFIQRDEVVTSPQLIDRPSLLGPPKEEPSGNTIDKLAKQILGQGTSGWSGEGFGSAEANAKDMARILAEAGITDINQFGTKIVDVPESRIFVDNEFGGFEQVTPASQRRIYYNKATDQEIMPNYSRAGGNIWSGTFAGKGSTGYGVRFDAQGNPQFYTEYGGTTSDWVPFRENILKPAALAAAAIYGIPLVAEALTGAAAGAGAAGAGAGAATAAELAAAAELASAAGTAAGTAGTLGTASAIPSVLVTAGKLAPVMTAAEIAALAAPVATGLLSTPSVTPSVPEPSNVVEVVEPSATMEVTGAKIKPPLEGIFPAVGASLLANAVTTPTTNVKPEKTPSKITPSDVIKGIGTAATVANLLTDGGKDTGFDIVDVPSDWRSPTRTTGTSGGVGGVGGVGNVPIDFGTMELLRGTQWERLINPAIQRSSVQTAMPGVMPGQLVQPRSIPTQEVINQIATAPTDRFAEEENFPDWSRIPQEAISNHDDFVDLSRILQEIRKTAPTAPVPEPHLATAPKDWFAEEEDFIDWSRLRQEARETAPPIPAPMTIEQLIASLPASPVVAPTVFTPPVISQPDDFGMLRRMQEFRETVPAPQQISADVSLIPQFPQSVGVPFPYMPPQSYTPIGQPMGLKSLIYALSNGQTDASPVV